MDPDQTASCCLQKNDLKSQAGDKADTIVVIGSLRIKKKLTISKHSHPFQNARISRPTLPPFRRLSTGLLE